MNQKYLKSILGYDPLTGIFIWKKPTKYHPRMMGKVAGGDGTGYILIRIDGKKWKAHKLAWLYMKGKLPHMDIDHKDGNALNNAIDNLRLCMNPQNQANRKRNKNKILPKGVRLNGRKYVARITFRKQQITIGTFKTAKEASDAYFNKSKELYQEFARAD